MDTKRLTLIIIFIALTAALNVAGPKIPAPYLPFLYYQVWEIPIVLAFLAIGPKAGVTITVINTLILLAVFPGALPIGPLYNFIAVLSMLLGIYVPYKLATRNCPTEKLSTFLQQHIKLISISATALGIALRVIVTTPVNYFALQLPYPFGFGVNSGGALAMLPLIAFFNATVALYTIPIALAVAIAILSRFKLQ
jgi:riboflavin transporter FmnP